MRALLLEFKRLTSQHLRRGQPLAAKTLIQLTDALLKVTEPPARVALPPQPRALESTFASPPFPQLRLAFESRSPAI